MENIRTILADLPSTIGGYTIYKDGFYTIVLNKNLNYERNIESYQHELKHIFQNDFSKKCSADMVEIYAHGE